MLKLLNIKKDYASSDEIVHALKGINVNFRENEFVAILGPSGCGKTTLLNIVGGLDRYDEGDLIIDGASTKEYTDATWDTYRNHRIGFVFQSYNLIGHISVLKNVELALTISGVKKEERRERALKALEEVGLSDKARKKPNQLSGGQQQRVAIARALVNNPEIILADEPTGALDSETSIQVMELLKEVARNRLVIMVTHNPQLAKDYSTRILKMKDGLILEDSNPCSEEELKNETKKALDYDNKDHEKTAMSLKTAISLSWTNLISKKFRTALVALGGSIGIIGIAVVLSISNGFNGYIMEVENNAMSTYPVTINEKSGFDVNSLVGNDSEQKHLEEYPDDGKIHENTYLTDMLQNMSNSNENNTHDFKEHLEKEESQNELKPYINGIQYAYSEGLNIYKWDSIDNTKNSKEAPKYSKVSPLLDSDSILYTSDTYMSNPRLIPALQKKYSEKYKENLGKIELFLQETNLSTFGEMLDNDKLLNNQYEVLKGHMPTNKNEIVIQLDKYNSINEVFLYALGYKDPAYYFSNMFYKMSKKTLPKPLPEPEFDSTIDDFIGQEFGLALKTQFYEKTSSDPIKYDYFGDEKDRFENVIDETIKLKIVGVIRPKEGVDSTSLTCPIGYSPELYEYITSQALNPTDDPFKNSTVLKDQLANPQINILTGLPFQEEIDETSYSSNLETFGYVDLSTPSSIYIYPNSFQGKQKVNEFIDDYNKNHTSEPITVVDNVGVMIDSVKTIIDSITYVLVAFVAVSLIVSSIMIGIITYVSVLERTKEIGVLRSLGARKKDVRRVFNAETLIIGFTAGLLGIALAAIFNIPTQYIVNYVSGVNLLFLIPWLGAIILPIISIILTIIAGLIPASIAAKKDPVIALRSE